jgi:hypothetical protein
MAGAGAVVAGIGAVMAGGGAASGGIAGAVLAGGGISPGGGCSPAFLLQAASDTISEAARAACMSFTVMPSRFVGMEVY